LEHILLYIQSFLMLNVNKKNQNGYATSEILMGPCPPATPAMVDFHSRASPTTQLPAAKGLGSRIIVISYTMKPTLLSSFWVVP
jgi:hypothetical protein